MPLQQVGPFNTGDIVAATTQNVHMDNANKLDRRTGFDPSQTGYVLCSAPTVAGLPNGVWQLITAANLGPQSVTNAALNALAVSDDKIAFQTILNRSLSTGLVDARALGPTAITDKLGYTPASTGGGSVGPWTITAASGQAGIAVNSLPFTINMFAQLGPGAYNSAVAANDSAIMAIANGPNTMSLMLGAWSSLAGGLGVRIDGPAGQVILYGPVNGNGPWNVTRNGPSSGASGPASVIGAQMTIMRPLGGSGVPALTLATQGVSAVVLYDLNNELWTIGNDGTRGRVWTSANDGVNSGLSADNVQGVPISLTAAFNTIPVAGLGGKLATAWIPAVTAPTANQIPLGDGAGKLAVGWLPATTTSSPNQIPIANASGKIDASFLPAAAGGSDVPVGLIALWAQAAGSVPTGWVVDTTFQGRFPVGVGGAIGAAVGGTGGAASHDHAFNNQHSHSGASLGVGGSLGSPSSTGTGGGTGATFADGSHSHSATALDVTGSTDNAGSTAQSVGAVGNLPPYLGVYYIRKV